MSAIEPAASARATLGLNPFALPDETRSRFVLMVLAGLVIAFVGGTTLRMLVLPEDQSPLTTLGALDVDINDPDFLQAHRDYGLALAGGVAEMVAPGLVLLLAVLALSRAVFVRYPGWLRRRRAAVTLRAGDGAAAQLAATVEAVARSGGVRPPDIEMYGPLTTQHAQVYGTSERPVLLLGRGTLLQVTRNPNDLVTVLNHEIGHIANGDVSRTYLTWSVLLATVSLALLPVLVGIVWLTLQQVATRLGDGSWSRFWGLNLPTATIGVGQVAGAALLLGLALASFLRVRETYADWRAASWGQRDQLLSILEQNRQAEGRTKRPPHLALHPSAGERIEALREPARLFSLSSEVAFVAGALAGIALPSLALLTMQAGLAVGALGSVAAASLTIAAEALSLAYLALWLGGIATILGVTSPFLLVAYFVSGALGLEVQRRAVADVYEGGVARGYAALWKPAIAMLLGVQLGATLIPLMPSSPLTMYAMQAHAGVNPLPVIPWSMAGVIAVWLCLAHTRYWSLRFLGRNLGSRPPVWKRRLITGSFAALIAPLLLAILAGQWVSSVSAAISGSQQDTAFMGPLLIGGFLVLTVLLVAAAFAAFGVLWFGLGLLNAADAAGCHACRAPWTQKPSVGTFCQSCGEPAGGWLLVTVKGSVSTSETG